MSKFFFQLHSNEQIKSVLLSMPAIVTSRKMVSIFQYAARFFFYLVFSCKLKNLFFSHQPSIDPLVVIEIDQLACCPCLKSRVEESGNTKVTSHLTNRQGEMPAISYLDGETKIAE